MGIETIAAIGVAVSAAAAGAETYQSREAASQARGARREQAFRAGQQQQALDEAKRVNDATEAARMARMRQRAMLSGGNQQTIASSPLGLSATQAGGGMAGAPQPLKSLGA